MCPFLPALAGATTAGQTRVIFADSIKEVTAPVPGAAAPKHLASLARMALQPQERAAWMEIEVALRMRNFPELQSRIAGGELISRAEMEAKYFPTAEDYKLVVGWLTSQGLAIIRTDDNHLAVFAAGTVDAVAQVFEVTFARVALDGAEYTSAVTAPSLPANVASPVLGIHGLQPHVRLHRLTTAKALKAQAVQGYIPSQILAAYHAVMPGIDGSGQTIAIIGDAFPAMSDLMSFWSQAGVAQSSANIQFIPVGAGPASPLSADKQEITLDAEWSSAIAPGAVVRVYGMSDTRGASFDKAYQQMYADLASQPGIHQFSSSYGGGEEDNTQAYLLTEAQYLANLAGAGVSIFSSSGDAGAATDAPANNRIQVTYPASDPSVTGVGGTSLTNLNATPPTEVVWSGSGGGISGFFPRPSWQTGQGVPPGSMRLVPDVASSADPNYGAFTVYGGGTNVVGGTSWASPTWAGFCALINQKLEQQLGGTAGMGVLNPKLYPLLGTGSFRDITSGSNGTYTAGVGYDMVTGIGVPDVSNLANNLTSGNSAPSIIGQLGNQVIVLGQVAAFSVVAEGAAPLAYQWQRLPSRSSTWINLSDGGPYGGSTTSTLVVSGVTYAMNGDQFQCLVSNSLGSAVSTPADLLLVNPVGVTTLAGLPGDAGYANGTGRAALFNGPGAVRTDVAGNIYLADNINNAIRKVTPAGVVTTVVGFSGVAGSRDGPVATAQLNDPSGVAIDVAGNIYIADGGNFTVRKISGGNVTTLAGTAGVQGSADGTGSAARFENPQNIAVDGSGNLYVPDGTDDAIRKITPPGVVTTLAGMPQTSGNVDGTGSGARFNSPEGIAVDVAGNVYVADSGNNTIRKISPAGAVVTLAGSSAGSADGAGSAAQFDSPTGVAVDPSGNVFVADSLNHAIREVTPSGNVTTIAGSAGLAGTTDGLGANARFDTPADVAIDGGGIVYVADGVNNSLRRIVQGSLVAPQIQTQPASGTVAAGQSELFTVSGTGSPPLTYQWQREPNGGSGFSNLTDGGSYSGSATTALTVSNTTVAMAGDQFQCVVANNAGSATSSAATLSISSAPAITSAQNQVQSVAAGSNLTLSVMASGGSLSYQWRLNGVNVNGATASTLALTNIQQANAGIYSVAITNSFGATSGIILTLSVQSARLVNLSARAFVGTGNNILITGFYIGGAGTRNLLLRGVGPTLASYGVTGVLAAPVLTLIDSNNNSITGNTGWGGAVTPPTGVWAGVVTPTQATSALFSRLSAFDLPAGSADSALVIGLPAGGYTSEISGVGATTGVALAEIYDADYLSGANSGVRLVNISARAAVGTGNNILIAGFVVQGTGSETVLLRGLGPAISGQVAGTLAQPVITLYDSNGNVITGNAGWGNAVTQPTGVWAGVATVSPATNAASTKLGASALTTGSADSALIVTLPAGRYSVLLSGANNTTGVALVELYESP